MEILCISRQYLVGSLPIEQYLYSLRSSQFKDLILCVDTGRTHRFVLQIEKIAEVPGQVHSSSCELLKVKFFSYARGIIRFVFFKSGEHGTKNFIAVLRLIQLTRHRHDR